MWAVIVLCIIPAFSLPLFSSLAESSDATVRILIKLYPLYVIMSAFLAWQLYGRRTMLCWLVLILLVLTHACFYYLATATCHVY